MSCNGCRCSEQRITYKMAAVAFKVEHTAHLSRHLQIGHRVRNLRSLPVNPLLFQPFSRIDFAKRGFLHSTLSSGTHCFGQYSKAPH